jgi:adenosylhomocysteine nucleosidase
MGSAGRNRGLSMDLCAHEIPRIGERRVASGSFDHSRVAITDPLGAARSWNGGRLGVLASHRSEVSCFTHLRGGEGPLILRSGGIAAKARSGAEQLGRQGIAGLVSFGLATGLAPVLRPGDLVLAESVVLPSGQAIRTDAAWRDALVRQLSGRELSVRVARLAGYDELLTSASAKRKAFQATFAAALDTDSHGVAEAASRLGLPFLVIRAVAEPAEQNLPSPLRVHGGEDDLLRGLGIAVRLLCRPWEFPSAWRFARNGRLALTSLSQAAAALALCSPQTAAAA